MTVHVNGQPLTLPGGASVSALLARLELGQKRVAVELNKELVPRRTWETARLREGDRVEVVTFVGGG